MRPDLVRWLSEHGLPTWLAPGYAATVGLAGLLGAYLALRLARHDGADVGLEARALGVGYLAALGGGYAIELVRVTLVALLTGDAVGSFGRAAYGGLIFGVAAAVIVIRHGKGPVVPFLDRLTPVLGTAYGFVRCGCFLAGCDYGTPTASFVGVRFPSGSSAARDHFARGWIPEGANSLPVHPTQLYEAGLAVIATIAAAYWLARGKRDGHAIVTWLGLYAMGRFAVELLRDDASRGVYGPLSSAQIISVALLVLLTTCCGARAASGTRSSRRARRGEPERPPAAAR
jgi:prolipoprotein diacylglyceryltransferase